MNSIKKQLLIGFAALVVLFGQATNTQAQVVSELKPVDDTYVWGSDIHGMKDVLCSYFSTAGQQYSRIIYLKFDLTGISPYLESAQLRMYVEKQNEGHQFDLYPVRLHTWAEDGINYDDYKTKLGAEVGTLLASAYIPDNGCASEYITWDSPELKKAIADSIMSGCRYYSFRIREKRPVYHPNGDKVEVMFHSKEHQSGFAPLLVLSAKNTEQLMAEKVLIDSEELPSFEASKFAYTVTLPWDATSVPTVTAEARDASVQVDVTPATNLTGTEKERTTTVKMSNGDDVLFYYIVFELAAPPTDATLSSIKVNDKVVKGFNKAKLAYVVYLPYTADALPPIVITPSDPNAQVQHLPAVNLEGNKEERTSIINCASANGAVREQYTIEFVKLPEMDLFLALGQSNMSGRAPYTNYTAPMENIYLLNELDELEISANPMNKYSNIGKDISLQGLSPAYQFALDVQKAVDKPIGIMVNAQGGSSITLWYQPGKTNYDASLKRAKELARFGQIKGIIWHQGSSDNGSGLNDNFAYYKNAMKTMVENFRRDLNAPDLIFICGDLSNRADVARFNEEVVRKVADYIPGSTYVTAEGTNLMSDNTHFDTPSNIILGERYAKSYLEYNNGTSVSDADINDESVTIACYAHEIKVINGMLPVGCKIYNVQGCLLSSTSLQANEPRTIQLEKGVYLIEVINGTNHRRVYKVLL